MKTTRFAFLAILAVILGCSGAATTPGKKIYEREEFRREFIGVRLDEVRAKLGPPDVTRPDISCWVYVGRTKHPKTGEPDRRVTLQHIDDRVQLIAFPD